MATEPRDERLEARVSRRQKELFQRAAAIRGRSLTDFVVSSAVEAAEETIRSSDLLTLSLRDSRKFADALIEPRAPNAALKAAARRYLTR